MPNQSLGLGTSIGGGLTSSYEKDGLKLYMPYNSPKEVKFVGQGSTSFDGSNDYIDCGTDSSLTVGTSDFTACAWVKLSSKGGSSWHDIVARGDTLSDGNGWGLNFNENDNRIYFDIGNASNNRENVTSGTNVWEYDKWYHVAVSRVNSADTMNIYLDGVLIATQSNRTNDDIADSSSNFRIGKSDDDRWTKGNIKNVGFWKRALSATEIQNVMYKSYAELSGTLKQGLNGWWALEGDYLDSTSNDNDGTNNGSTANTSLYGGATPLIPRGVDNAPTVQADAIGTGYATFNGTDDNIQMSDIVCDTDGNTSILFWAKRTGGIGTEDSVLGNTTGNYHSIVRFTDAATSNILEIESDDTSAGDTATITLNTPANDSSWHHYAIIASSGDITAYQDGVKCSVSGVDMSYNTTINVMGGAGTDGEDKNFQGQLKNIGIWKDNSLTQAQVQSIMEKTYSELTSSEKTNLTSWWGLDSTEGTNALFVKDEHDTTVGSNILTGTWSASGNWSSNSDGTIISTTSETTTMMQSSLLALNKIYKVSYTANVTSGSFKAYAGSGGSGNTITSSGDYVEYIKCTGSTHFYFDGVSSFTGSISDMSVQLVNGNYGELK